MSIITEEAEYQVPYDCRGLYAFHAAFFCKEVVSYVVKCENRSSSPEIPLNIACIIVVVTMEFVETAIYPRHIPRTVA